LASVPLPDPVPSWDSPPLSSGDTSAVLVTSPETAAELAGIRQVLAFGLALLVLLATAQLIKSSR
jgi:hypothetical protein